MTSIKTGQHWEQVACNYLLDKKLKLIQRNYISKYGEIDIIMQDLATVVFVEVRARKNSFYGAPIETINAKKRAKMVKTASCFLLNNRIYSALPYRFDAISFITTKPINSAQPYDLTWYKNFITADN